ncbi:MAG: hypothetical protein FWC12_11360 [Treponema sp.]|nr:hypothetical protein [Treponema sp.]
MKCKFAVSLALILLCLLVGCPGTEENDPDPSDPLYPFKDDPTTVGNFKTSKFDGFWQVTSNLEADWDNPPILNHPPMLYIFRENTFQIVAGTRDWSDITDYGKLSEMNKSWKPYEFMYSKNTIYEWFYHIPAWRKANYIASLDGNNLSYGRDKMIKIYPEWTKEDLISCSWYFIEDLLWSYYYHLFTFTEDTINIQTHELYEDGSLSNDFYTYSTPITLTDGFFKIIEDIDEDIDFVNYYYIVFDKLIFSTGEVLHPVR